MQLVKIRKTKPQKGILKYAAAAIRDGKVVVFPTETVYGIGADALNRRAVSRIFKIKGRPADNPLIVHIGTEKQLRLLTDSVDAVSKKLMKKFWPGPLTLIFAKKDAVPDNVTAGLDTIAVRMPHNKIAFDLARLAGPIAAPSANKSGKPSPTAVGHVLEDLTYKETKLIEIVLDGGETKHGLESTVFDSVSKRILRPGPITLKHIRNIVPEANYATASPDKPASPGMKYTHYSPKARVVLFIGNHEKIVKKMKELGNEKTVVLDLKGNKREVAKTLYARLREIDHQGFEKIFCEGIEEEGLGYSIMDRLRKAASKTFTFP